MQVYRSALTCRLPFALLQRQAYSTEANTNNNNDESNKPASPFQSKFGDFQKILYKIRGMDTARCMDSNIYRVTPQYEESTVDELNAPLNKKEGFTYHERTEKVKFVYNFTLKNEEIVPDGADPYYARLYKPLNEHLEKIYPTHFSIPEGEEGLTTPVLPPPQNETLNMQHPQLRTWRNVFVELNRN